VDNDVSVARLPDDDWNDRNPPGPGSRIRMLAVMGAVVVGCGVAAIVVNLAPSDRDDRADDGGERIVVIDPERTDLYPTQTVAPTSSHEIVSETTNPTRQISSSPLEELPDGGGEPPGDTGPGDSDDVGDPGDPTDPDDGDEDPDEATTTPSTPPSGPTSTPPPSTPPTTTPSDDPDDGEDEEEEEEECTPKWWIGCWF
jgi:hypothetical protein